MDVFDPQSDRPSWVIVCKDFDHSYSVTLVSSAFKAVILGQPYEGIFKGFTSVATMI